MVEFGKRNGKKVGEWYGPGSVAHVLKEAVKQAAKENIDLASLHVYVAQDCTIYNQDIFDECYSQELKTSVAPPWQNKPKSASASSSPRRTRNVITWKHLILLIPLRLGHEKLNPIYTDCLKAMLSLEWCVGIIGGRPKHSLYFVGYQDDKLIHLDPHYCQDLVDVNIEHFPVSSFHCRSARKMKISKMDPSCCIGFYIPTRNEYDRFQATIQPYLQPVKNFTERHKTIQSTSSCLKPPSVMYDQTAYPMFIFQPGRLRDETNKSARLQSVPLNSALRNLQLDTEQDDDADDGIEDFVIL
jgi:cysteine protease ATG4